MGEERELAEIAVSQGLLGQSALTEQEIPPTPEKYTLKERIGSGGAGVVFLAEDTTLQRPVALKFLQASAHLERFKREARFTARLNDPAIVQVYETGEVDGQPFIAMQYVDGGNLAAADLDTTGTVKIIRQVASALAHAHGEGIVHRDIKPENILIDSSGRAYLTDFGIAHDLRGTMGGTISLQGQIMGTPALMPPEQARGDQHAVDERADVYALGATLFFKLTGRYPFAATNVVDLLHKVIHEEAPFPRSIVTGIPRALESIVLRCLRKSRNARYESMDALIKELDRFLAGSDLTAAPAAWFRTLVSEGGADVPQESLETTSEDSEIAAAMETAREISRWDGELYRVRSNLPRTFPKLERIIERVDSILKKRPATAWARFYRGAALFRLGEIDQAVEEMERAIDRTPDRSTGFFELGRAYLALFLREQDSARKHMSLVGERDHLDTARSLLDQAVAAFEEAQRLKADLPAWQVRYAKAVQRLAESDFDGCIEECDAITGEEPDAEEVWKLKGDAERLAGRPPYQSYDRALEVRRSYYQVELAKADAHLDAGDLEPAREALKRAVEIHPGSIRAQTLLARTCLRAGALETGMEHARRARDLSPQDHEAAVTLAEIQLEAGEPGEALKTLESAKELRGCQNRVSFLRGHALLERARRGGSAAAKDLDEVLSMGAGLHAQVPDNKPWLELLTKARDLLHKSSHTPKSG